MLRIILVLMAVWLSGCTSVSPLTPQVTYYLLDEIPKAQIQEQIQSDQPQIQVARIAVPDYLNRPSLVMRRNNQQMTFANYHSWADSLPTAMQRVIVSALNQTSATVQYTRHCTLRKCAQLQIVVDHFYPTETGDVVLSGSYSFTGTTAKSSPKPFTLTETLKSGGYNEAVQKMRELLFDLAEQIQRQKGEGDHLSGGHDKASVQNTGVVF